MKTRIVLVLVALSFTLGCNGLPGTGDAGPLDGGADGGALVDDGGGAQGWREDCEACLAQPGMNWTGGMCEDACLQDTYCYGPGNPAAPECPDTEPEAE